MDEHVAGRGTARRARRRSSSACDQLDRAAARPDSACVAERAAIGAAVDAVGAEVLDHERHVVATGEAPAPRVEQHVGPLAPDQAADEQEARAAERPSSAVTRGAAGVKQLEVDAVGDHVHALGIDAALPGTSRARIRSGTHSSSTCASICASQSRGTAPNSHGTIAARRPAGGGLQVRRPLVADLDVGGVGEGRIQRLRAVARDRAAPARQAARSPGR